MKENDSNIWEIISAKIKGEELSTDDNNAFNLWISESEENKKIYSQLYSFYIKYGILKDIDTDGALKRVKSAIHASSLNKSSIFKRIILSTAAAAAIVAGVFISIFHYSSERQEYNSECTACSLSLHNTGSSNVVLKICGGKEMEITAENNMEINEDRLKASNIDGLLKCHNAVANKLNVADNIIKTPIGKDYKLILSDGTQVWLNSDSYLYFPSGFDPSVRRIKLCGEACFKVSKSAEWPFIVETDKIDVRVTGTFFDVKAYEDDDKCTATLIEGSVDVIGKINSQQKVKLVKNQQFCIDNLSGYSEVKSVDTGLFTSWIDNMFVFKDVALGEIMRDISRWYKVKYKFMDSGASNIIISASIERNKGIDNIMEMLGRLNKVSIKKEGNVFILESKNKVVEQPKL